jgi:mannose-1-phosphate guanylyltransferase/mannose-6-phosphate isomerase
MPTSPVIPVILCGGFGERLWPLSRQLSPKQFTPLVDGRHLFDLALERAQAIIGTGNVIAIGNEDHRFLMAEALRKSGLDWQILLEPVARNTAAAICAAGLAASQSHDDPTLVIMPSDHFIPDTASFAEAIATACSAASNGSWVTLGISPAGPSTQYGYIVPQGEADASGTRTIGEFTEKPQKAVAAQLLQRNALWNAGIFIVKASAALNSFRELQPAIFEACETAWSGACPDGGFIRLEETAFAKAPALPVDIAIMEKADAAKVVPFKGNWDDLGSWSAVAGLSDPDTNGNRASGDVRLFGSNNIYVRSPNRLTVALGVENVVIIDTPDALLVADKTKLDDMRDVVRSLRDEDHPAVSDHTHVARPWGAYESLAVGDRYQVKRIFVNPGAALSLQYHHHRAEHWVVVSGTARVTRGDEVFDLSPNQSTYIPLGEVHRLENPGKEMLQLIEVQSGDYLGEDDIVRLEDVYGRKEGAAE